MSQRLESMRKDILSVERALDYTVETVTRGNGFWNTGAAGEILADRTSPFLAMRFLRWTLLMWIKQEGKTIL